MLRPEAGSNPFQPKIEYSDPTLAPITVARNTSTFMEDYLKDPERAEPAKDYLTNQTTTFLYMAERGFVSNFPNLRRVENIDAEVLRMLVQLGISFGNSNPEETEAFGHTIITMGLLPSMAQHALLPDGFSRRGVLAPPSTIGEYHQRIRELRTVVSRVAEGKMSPELDMLNNQPLCRTYCFFEVGARIPLKNPVNERKDFNDMLEGIEIDL